MIYSLLNKSKPILKRLIQKLSHLETDSTTKPATQLEATLQGPSCRPWCSVCSLNLTKSTQPKTGMWSPEYYVSPLNNSLCRDVPSTHLPTRRRDVESLAMLWFQFSPRCLDSRSCWLNLNRSVNQFPLIIRWWRKQNW